MNWKRYLLWIVDTAAYEPITSGGGQIIGVCVQCTYMDVNFVDMCTVPSNYMQVWSSMVQWLYVLLTTYEVWTLCVDLAGLSSNATAECFFAGQILTSFALIYQCTLVCIDEIRSSKLAQMARNTMYRITFKTLIFHLSVSHWVQTSLWAIHIRHCTLYKHYTHHTLESK